ncbi:MAG: AAA family ATPase [Candidatus Hadarchaeales archaeon]
MRVLPENAASQRGINEAKRLRELSYFCPYSDWKVFVLDEVHALTTEACNVLLKLLEEPPPNVVYILATTNPEKVLPTVLSRCQRFNFFPLTVEEIKRVLMTVVEGEGIEATPEAISMIASHARGSARDALTLLEQLTILYPSIGEEEVLEFLGLPGKEIIGAFFRALCERNFPLLFSMLDQLSLQGVSYRGFFEALKEGIRSLMVRWVAESLDERALSQYRDVLEREKDELWSLVPPSLSVPDIVRWGERFAEGRPEGEQESKEWLENFCFRECYFATTGKEMIDMENIRRGAALPKRLGGRRGEVQPPAASGDAMVDGGGPSPRLVIGSASPFQGDVEGRTEAEEEAKEESLTRSGPAISGSPEAERLLRKISNMMSSLYSKGRLSLSPEEREKLKMGLEKYFLLSLGGDGRGLRCPSPPSLCPSGLVPRIFPREERETCPFCGSRLVELT